ncbi:MAG: 3-deoxy-D-manno-octulosonic acid transferase, partial [Deinococcales bacterium]|nr:3-deoxy-D-manno-octulosonic acid transferase [Chitinophagaceae bacterium]
MKFLYLLFIRIYPFIAKLISPQNEKAKLWVVGRKNIFKNLAKAFARNTSPVVWMHCASLGEFEQGLPIIEK